MSLLLTFFTLIMLAAMGILLVIQALPIASGVGLDNFLGTQWSFRHGEYGVLSMLYGTVVVACLALALAVPLGVGTAIFTAEYLPQRWRLIIKTFVELLAGIPSVVYGLIGILILRNYVYNWLTWAGYDPVSGDSLLTAGVLLSVMILPTIMTMSDDALVSVPGTQRLAALSLGLSKGEVVFSVTLPQARRGLLAAALLALGRALGETIAVFLVVGRQDGQWPQSLISIEPITKAGQTLTSKLGGPETNIAYGDSTHWAAIIGLGLTLLALVGLVTMVGCWLGREARHA